MAEQSVVAVYDTMTHAEEAVQKLDAAKFPIKQVSLITQNLASEKQIHGYVTACDVSQAGAQTGAWLGGLFGLLAGAAFVWVPGFGPLIVAGSLSAALLGGVEGALVGAAGGGLLGGLMGWGISKQHIIKYEEVVRGGKFLVVAHGSPAEVVQAKSALEGTGASELTLHADAA